MAENITDEIQIRSDPSFDEFYTLFRNFLPESFLDLYNSNYEEIYSYFNGLSGDDQLQTLAFLRSRSRFPIAVFHSSLRYQSITVDSVFRALEAASAWFAELQETEIYHYGAPAASRFWTLSQGSQASYAILQGADGDRAASLLQSLLQRSQASHVIPQATEMYPYGDPYGVTYGDPYAALIQSHSQRPATSYNNLPGHAEMYPYGDPYGDPYGVTYGDPYAALFQSHSQRPATSYNNLPGHAEMYPYGDPYGVTYGDPYAALFQSHSQRPATSYNNLPGHDGVVIIPADDEFPSGHRTILSEVRATRDDETAGHSTLFKTLLPVNFTNAYKAGKILKSTYHILQPSIKTSGYLTVAIACTAVFSSLAGLSLSTFKPSTLPFGCNPQLMLQIMHNVAVHTTAYAFIGTMCHEFLQDDPFIMWIVAGLASAVFMAVMVFFGRRI